MNNFHKAGLVLSGIAFSIFIGLVVTSPAHAEPEVKSDETVVLGHRIGPNGQEMLVYR